MRSIDLTRPTSAAEATAALAGELRGRRRLELGLEYIDSQPIGIRLKGHELPAHYAHLHGEGSRPPGSEAETRVCAWPWVRHT